MAHHIIFTSTFSALSGESGFGILAESPNVPKYLSDEITQVAANKEIFAIKDPNRNLNSVNFFFYIFDKWYVLGKIKSTSNDHRGSFNYLGQFFALDIFELQDCGPVAILGVLPFVKSFEGEPRILPPCVIPIVPNPAKEICHQWASVTGDAGWGGALAESLQLDQTSIVLYDNALPGSKCLDLIGESLSLLSPENRWNVTFSTHGDWFPRVNLVKLRMLQQGSDLSNQFKANSYFINLTQKPMPPARGGELVTAARNGDHPGENPSPGCSNPDPSPAPMEFQEEQIPPIPKINLKPSKFEKSGGWRSTSMDWKKEYRTRSPGGPNRGEYRGLKPFLVFGVPIALVLLFIGFWGGTAMMREGLEECENKIVIQKEEMKKNAQEVIAKQKELELVMEKFNDSKRDFEEFKKNIDSEMDDLNLVIKEELKSRHSLESKFYQSEKFKSLVESFPRFKIKRQQNEDEFFNDLRIQIEKLISFYDLQNGNEEFIKGAIKFKDKINTILEKTKEIFEIEIKNINRIGNILLYDNKLKNIIRNKFNADADYEKASSSFIVNLEKIKKSAKTMQTGELQKEFNVQKTFLRDLNLFISDLDQIIESQNSKLAKINDINDISLASGKLSFIFGESNEGYKKYQYLKQDFFEGFINESELDDPASARSREFINLCALYFLEKTKLNELFSENGKFAKQRFEFMKSNKKVLVKYMEKYKKTKLLKGMEDDIDKFNQAMADVFGN